MPTVPELHEPRVAPAALPGAHVAVNAPIEAFGGGGADRTVDLRGMQRTAVAIYQEQKKNADEIATNDADNQLQQAATKILFDPEKGALNQRGKNAFDVPSTVQEQWSKAVSDITGKLGNDYQKTAFMHRANSRWQSVNETVQRHVAGERKAYDKDTTAGIVEGRVQDALANYTDPTAVERAVGEAAAAIRDYGYRNGMSKEDVEDQVAKTQSHAYTEVINRHLANENDLAAKDFYDSHKKQIVGADTISVEKSLQEGNSRGESQRISDKIMSRKDISLSDALEAARDVKDPRVRDLVEQRVRQRFSENKAADEEAKERNFKNASDFVEQTHGTRAPAPNIWSALSLQEREALDRRRKQLTEGETPKTNWTRYYDLMTIASDPERRDDFVKMSLLKDRWQLADGQFEQLTSLQASLRGRESTAETKLGHYRATASAINDNLMGAGINPHNMNADNQVKVNAFRNSVYEQIQRMEEETGKPVKAPDVQKVIENMLTKGIVAKHWYGDTERRVFELQPGEQLQLQVKDIPRSELNDIRGALQRRNIPITDQRVLQLYTQRIQSMRPPE